MEIKYNLIGGVTDATAIVTSTLDFQLAPTGDPDLKVMRLEYSSGSYKVYVNGELVSTATNRTGNLAYVYNMMLGSDADNVAFFKGYIPELLIYKNTPILSNSNDIERWLADKWLSTGTNLNGYPVKDTQGVFPTVTGSTKWLHFDETSLNITGEKITSITDKASFMGVTKVGTPITVGNQPNVELNKFKGKTVARYNGNQNFKIPGLSQSGDPDYFTMFIVYRFDDIYASGDDQTMIGAVTNDASPTYNTAIRIKKYLSDGYLDARISVGGFAYAEVPLDKAYTLGLPANVLLGTQQLMYSTDANFISGLNYSTVVNAFSDSNGTNKFNLNGLLPDTKYYSKVIIDGITKPEVISFKTFPVVGTPTSFKFIAGSCNYSGSNTPIWTEIKNENPLFWSHMGDWHYEDIAANNLQLFRDAFSMTAKAPNLVDLNRNVPLAYMFDDHDYGANNSDRDSLSKPAAIAHYIENVPHYPFIGDPMTNSICQSWTVGRVKFIQTDMRSQRSNFLENDYSTTKTMLGENQKAWFKNELLDAKNDVNIQMICWLNPSPWTGENLNGYSWDYGSSGEHWTAYKVERTELYNFILENDIRNIFIVNGDTHQQGIDDGRNAIFNDVNGATIEWKSLNPNIITPVIESSPFDKDVDRGSGQFQINDLGDSGAVAVLSERTYSTFDIIDEGKNFIRVDVKQYVLPDGLTYYTEKTLVNEFSFIRDCVGTSADKPIIDNSAYEKLSGVFQIPTNEIKVDRKILFSSPTSFNNNWKAPISGTITITPFTNKEVRVYRRSDEDYEVGICPVDASNGNWIFNGNKGTSQLVFKIIDTTTGNILITEDNDGNYGKVYNDLKAELYYTTDTDYLQQTKTVSDLNRFEFNFFNTGQKAKIKLVRKSTGAVLAETPIRGVLPRSYQLEDGNPDLLTPFPTKSYLYDAGLALIASVGSGNYSLANEIVNGTILSQFNNGSFPFSANHVNPVGADAYLRTGAIAWVAYALGYFLEKYPTSPSKNEVESTLNEVLTYITSLRSDNGLVTGGSGRYTISNGVETFNPDYVIPWVSTEHNIDSYFAFKQAGLVLKSREYTTISKEIGNALIEHLYDAGGERMFQGINADGTKDTADALDINSWGAIAMVSLGRNDIASHLLKRLERFYLCSDVNNGAVGYKPYSDELGYPNALDTVWFEGSYGVALAYYKVGNINKYQRIMNNLFKYVESDGSFRYATLRDQTYEIGNNKSMASTSWSVISNVLKQSVWS